MLDQAHGAWFNGQGKNDGGREAGAGGGASAPGQPKAYKDPLPTSPWRHPASAISAATLLGQASTRFPRQGSAKPAPNIPSLRPTNSRSSRTPPALHATDVRSSGAWSSGNPTTLHA